MIMNFELHPYHIVEESPWPFLLGSSSLCFFLSFINFFYFSEISPFFFNFMMMIFLLFLWGRDIVRESNYLGYHTTEIENSMKWSMGWFISSEVLFFFAFFWGYFTFTLSTTVEGGNMWPPLCVVPLEAFAIPLLNTVILLSSGISLTWAHHALLGGNHKNMVFGLFLTIFLGIYFTFLQIFEYMESTFCFNDSLYGSIFFIATGFHGLHVIIGTLLLLIVFFRSLKNHHYNNHHIGMETASWYWHFVDVVWLFLFCCIYWWGS